jgi:hypothetical protein
MSPEPRTTPTGSKVRGGGIVAVGGRLELAPVDPPAEPVPSEGESSLGSDGLGVPTPETVAETVPSDVATAKVADRAPTAVGSKLTSIEQDEKPVTVPPEEHVPPVTEKSEASAPMTEIPAASIIRIAAPELPSDRT